MIVLCVLGVILLQSVVFSRLNLFGATPDLALVLVIIYAILCDIQPAALFSAATGFLQDLLSFGSYTQTVTKVAVSALVGVIKESFAGNEYLLSLISVAVFTPLVLICQAWILDKQIGFYSFALKIILTTVYNLILTPVLFALLKKAAHV